MNYYVAPVASDPLFMPVVCEPEEAEFWSLYLRDDDGTSAWISDHDTEAEAIAVMEQNRAKDALLASGPIENPPTREQHGLRLWLADTVGEEILSFGESGEGEARASFPARGGRPPSAPRM